MSGPWKPVRKSGRALVVIIAAGKVSSAVTANVGGARVSSVIAAGDSVVAAVAGAAVVVRRTAVSAVVRRSEVSWGAKDVFLKYLGETGAFLVVVVITGGAAWKRHSQDESQIRAFTTDPEESQPRN